MKHCIVIDESGAASQVFECTEDITKVHVLKTFVSNDISRLRRIQQNYKTSKLPLITKEVKMQMLKYRTENQWGPLRDMLKKYLNVDACCSTVMDQILAGL